MTAGTWTELLGAVATFLAVVAAIVLPRRQRAHDLADRAAEAAARGAHQEMTDYDNTRLLLYVALMAARQGMSLDAQMAGTIVHALSEHSHLLPVNDAFLLGSRAIVGHTDQKQLQDLIDELCRRRGENSPAWQ